MLATTAAGDVYTFDEYARMLAGAGFTRTEWRSLAVAKEQVILACEG